MDKLIEAAKAEGTLNVIALPPDWANYGEMLSAFEAKYGLKIDSAQPDANSQDEINAAKQLAGQDRAPDVFDLGVNVALANTDLFAPYQVASFGDVPAWDYFWQLNIARTLRPRSRTCSSRSIRARSR